MSAPAQAALLPDGRLHLHHGPIDLLITAEGPARALALRAAAQRFSSLLEGLVADLPALRRPISCGGAAAGHGRTPHPPTRARPYPAAAPPQQDVRDPVARRMVRAVQPFAPLFVTPMAAVAGAVADEILATLRSVGPLRRAIVNNGGDVALWLAPGETAQADLAGFAAVGLTVTADTGIGGVATSGWRGRSHSLGIADAVTVLAADAAGADAAATLIANAVDLPGHPAILRRSAVDLAPDSDLGLRPVTVDVGPLRPEEIAQALAAGAARARAFLDRGLIGGAWLQLSGASVPVLGAPLRGLLPVPSMSERADGSACGMAGALGGPGA